MASSLLPQHRIVRHGPTLSIFQPHRCRHRLASLRVKSLSANSFIDQKGSVRCIRMRLAYEEYGAKKVKKRISIWNSLTSWSLLVSHPLPSNLLRFLLGPFIRWLYTACTIPTTKQRLERTRTRLRHGYIDHQVPTIPQHRIVLSIICLMRNEWSDVHPKFLRLVIGWDRIG